MKRYYGRDAPNVQVKLMWSQGSGGDFGKAMGRPEGMGGGVRGSRGSISIGSPESFYISLPESLF